MLLVHNATHSSWFILKASNDTYIHSKVARQCKNCATVSPFGIISRTRAHLSRFEGVDLVPLGPRLYWNLSLANKFRNIDKVQSLITYVKSNFRSNFTRFIQYYVSSIVSFKVLYSFSQISHRIHKNSTLFLSTF